MGRTLEEFLAELIASAKEIDWDEYLAPPDLCDNLISKEAWDALVKNATPLIDDAVASEAGGQPAALQ